LTIRFRSAHLARRKKPVISARKNPRQTRSTQLVAAILEGAIRVLVRDGAYRFTTARVAEAAGVSVGAPTRLKAVGIEPTSRHIATAMLLSFQ
jgi:hypothetical protein